MKTRLLGCAAALCLLAPAALAGSVSGTSGTLDETLVDPPTSGQFPHFVCSSGCSGGGGAVTVADGADVTLGAKGDTAWTLSGNATAISALKEVAVLLNSILVSTTPSQVYQTSETPIVISTLTTGCGVISAAPAWLYDIQGKISATTTKIVFIDATSIPADAATIALKYAIPTNGAAGFFSKSLNAPIAFSTGIVACIDTGSSWTAKTGDTTAGLSLQAIYR